LIDTAHLFIHNCMKIECVIVYVLEYFALLIFPIC